MSDLGGIGYGALIDKVTERGLALHSLPKDDLDRMVHDLTALLDASA